MNVARKWVFPIIRILIFAAIAVALVKIAFYADPTPEESVAQPTGEIVEQQVAVTVGTVLNDVTVTGTVAADAARPIKATLAGEVVEIIKKQGKTVKKGDKVLTIKADIPGEMTEDGEFTEGYTKLVTVKAPAKGVISDLSVIKGQLVEVGDAVGQIAPPTFNVSGTIEPAQLYRLLEQPEEATVTVIGGPAPFTCDDLTITTPLAGEAAGEDGSGGTGGSTVTCDVPSDVTVFSGLQAEMSIPGGTAENVLIVPVTAVEGVAESGNVYAVLPDGTTEVRPVTLGLNDGINVEITGGLAEGDMILQFVPGAPEAPIDEGCYDQGDGTIICDDGVMAG